MAQQESQNITLPMSGTGKTDFSLIKSDTTVLHSLECPVNEDFRRSLHDHFVKRMGEDGARRCEAIRGLLDAIGRMLESNDGWLPLADGTFYCAKLDAVLPAPSDVTFRNCYVQLGSLTPANGTPQSWDWQSADSSSDARHCSEPDAHIGKLPNCFIPCNIKAPWIYYFFLNNNSMLS